MLRLLGVYLPHRTYVLSGALSPGLRLPAIAWRPSGALTERRSEAQNTPSFALVVRSTAMLRLNLRVSADPATDFAGIVVCAPCHSHLIERQRDANLANKGGVISLFLLPLFPRSRICRPSQGVN